MTDVCYLEETPNATLEPGRCCREPSEDVTSAARRPSIADRAINLDANANAAATSSVVAAVNEALLCGAANPSSSHRRGGKSRQVLEEARDAVSAAIAGSQEDGVIFTSGCTEANNAVLLSGRLGRPATMIVTATEHPSVLRPAQVAAAQGGTLHVVPVDADGRIDLDRLREELNASDGPVILSVQHANSETGVIQPIAEIAGIVAGREAVLFHSDAAQTFGRIPVAVGGPMAPGVVTVSGHKLHGPMGVGAMVLAPEEERIGPIVHGGDQERGLRAGTQALPLIAGFAAACRDRLTHFESDVATMRRTRDLLEAGLRALVPWASFNGAGASRLPNTSNVRFPGVDGMALVANLDDVGVSCSIGSACTSGHPEPSHVLLAMGLSRNDAFSSVRFSTSPLNTAEEIEIAVELIATAAGRLRDRT